MTQQIIQTQGSATGSVLEAANAGKGDAKGGVFGKLIASFQKHIKQGETHSQVDGQNILGKEKISQKGLQMTLPKINPEHAEGAGKVKSLLKVADAGKVAEGEQVKAGNGLLSKSPLQGLNTQGLVKQGDEQKDLLNAEKLVADDTEKLQKHAAMSLGVFQQESRDVMIKKGAGSKAKEEVLAGLEGKKNKGAENSAKPPRMTMDTQEVAGKQGVQVGQNKTEGLITQTIIPEGKSVEIVSGKQIAGKQTEQARFSLKNVDGVDDDIDVSKLIKRDETISVKQQQKGEETSAKPMPLASAASASDDMKAMSQDDGNVRQGLNSNSLRDKQAKASGVQQGLDAVEKASKVKPAFKAVIANRSGLAGSSAQASASVASTIAQGDVAIKSSGGQDANMTGDDRGMGRSAAEILMTDGSARDIRSTRSDFAMQMAYRSAASFKPSDAMLEISKAAKDGTVKLELMLEPATLGKIQVSLQMDAQKHIQVHLIVDQQTSRQVLEQQLPQLRQALADQGLNLSGFTMDMNSQQQGEGKASHGVAGMDHIGGHGESENVMRLETPLRMGVNMADDGSLSILA